MKSIVLIFRSLIAEEGEEDPQDVRRDARDGGGRGEGGGVWGGDVRMQGCV